MVNVPELGSAKTELWADASADWRALGSDLGYDAEDLKNAAWFSTTSDVVSGQVSLPTTPPPWGGGNIVPPYESSEWTGAAAEAAAERVLAAINAIDAGQAEVNAVSDVLQGLADAIEVCQRTLAEAQELARHYHLTIAQNGAVSAPASAQRGLFGIPADLVPVTQVQDLVTQALESATKADQTAAAELRVLASHAGLTNQAAAYGSNLYPNGDGLTASNFELAMISDSIPSGPPSLVSQWWAGLTPAEQKMLMGAAAGKLGTLDGIPPSVQAELRGDSGINRVAVVNFALDNVNNQGIDIPDTDNCTNFVSNAIQAGGLAQRGAIEGDPFNTNTPGAWFHYSVGVSSIPIIGGKLQRYSSEKTSSQSWDVAGSLYQFLTQSTTSKAVPYSQAQPGDIAFWTDSGGFEHSAVVTAVVNGQVFYTQHTPGEENADWGSRQDFPGYSQTLSNDPWNITIVQPGGYPSG